MRISDWSSDVCSSDLAYLKMLVVGEGVYAMLIEPDAAQLWKSDIAASDLDQAVDTIRSTISIVEIGRAHVSTPVTNAHLVCRLLLVQKIHHTPLVSRHLLLKI